MGLGQKKNKKEKKEKGREGCDSGLCKWERRKWERKRWGTWASGLGFSVHIQNK